MLLIQLIVVGLVAIEAILFQAPSSFYVNQFSCASGPSGPLIIGEMTKRPCGVPQDQGGNVTIEILHGKNIPNHDHFVFSSVSDPYVVVKIANYEFRTPAINNNLNPVWDAETSTFNLGVRSSGTQVTLEVWDYNDGFEGADYNLASAVVNIPLCSIFGSSISDATIKQATGNTCIEETYVPLIPGQVCLGGNNTQGVYDPSLFITTSSCLRVRFTIVAFDVQTLDFDVPLTLTVAGTYPSNPLHWGKPWLSFSKQVDGSGNVYFFNATGGILVRMPAVPIGYSNTAALTLKQYSQITSNLPVNAFVFISQNNVPASVPLWLTDTYNNSYGDGAGYGGWSAVPNQYMIISGDTTKYLGWTQTFNASVPWVVGGPSYGLPPGTAAADLWYVVVLRMVIQPDMIIPPVAVVIFDRAGFILIVLQFAIPFAFFFFLAYKFSKDELKWRFDRIDTWLVCLLTEKSEDENNRNTVHLLATCFLCFGNNSPSNIDFRWNLWAAKAMIMVLLATPVVILWAWGISCGMSIQPAALGFAIVFFGSAALVTGFGLMQWRALNFRMESSVLISFTYGFLMLVAFLVCSVFNGIGGTSLIPLSIVFNFLNIVPLIMISFINDSELTESFKLLSEIAHENIDLSKNDLDGTSANLIGHMCSQCENVSAIKKCDQCDDVYCDSCFNENHAKGKRAEHTFVMLDADQVAKAEAEKNRPKEFIDLVGTSTYTIDNKNRTFAYENILGSIWGKSAQAKRQLSMFLYGISLAVLAIYVILTYTTLTSYQYQGLINAFSLIVLDTGIYLLQRGGCNWSPGYVSMILLLVRAFICAFGGDYFIIGYTLAFMVFGMSVCNEIVSRRLYIITPQQAGAVAYFGRDGLHPPIYDLAGAPEMVLLYSTFVFIFFLIVFIFTVNNQVYITMIGGKPWPTWVFSIGGIMFVQIYGMFISTKKAFEKQMRGILTSKYYFWFRWFELPEVLAIGTEILVVSCGILLYALTLSRFILISSIMVPPIILFGGATFMMWVSNDYNILQNPLLRPGAVLPKMNEEVMVEETDKPWETSKGDTKGETAFSLPPLTRTDLSAPTSPTGFKMPLLPTKRPVKETDASLLAKNDAFSPFAPAKPVREDASLLAKNDPFSPFSPIKAVKKENIDDGASPSDQIEGGEKKEGDEKKDGEEKKEGQDDQQNGEKKEGENSKDGASVPVVPKAPRKPFKDYFKIEVPEDSAKMPWWMALYYRKLTIQDYKILSLGILTLVLIFVWGMILWGVGDSPFIGQAVWFAAFSILFSVTPIYKYFYTYTWGVGQTVSVIFGAIFLIGGCILQFVVFLHSDVTDVTCLFLLALICWMPTSIIFVTAVSMWKDNKWVVTKNLNYCFIGFGIMSVSWVWTMFIFTNPYFGVTGVLALIFFFIAYFYIKAWSQNDYYLPPSYNRWAFIMGTTVVIASIAIGFVFDVNLFYCFTIAFSVLIGQFYAMYLGRAANWKPGCPVYFSSYIFPIYVFNPVKNIVENENAAGAAIYGGLFSMLFWGITIMVFVLPLEYGAAIVAITLVFIEATTAELISLAPKQLAQSSLCTDKRVLDGAAIAARWEFNIRRKPLEVMVDDLREEIEREVAEQKMLTKYSKPKVGKKKKMVRKTAKIVGDAIGKVMDNLYSREIKEEDLGFITLNVKELKRHDALLTLYNVFLISVDAAAPTLIPVLKKIKNFFVNARASMKEKMKRKPKVAAIKKDDILEKKEESQPEEKKEEEEKKESEGGKKEGEEKKEGDGAEGEKKVQELSFFERERARIKKLEDENKKKEEEERKQREENERKMKEDIENQMRADLEAAEREKLNDLTQLQDSLGMLRSLRAQDEQLAVEFAEEARLKVFFEVLTMVSSESRLRREGILFQRFLRENRFKLLANNIAPPDNIFKTQSFASVDVALVATWLQSLTPEQRERFNTLKQRFTEEDAERDDLRDKDDVNVQRETFKLQTRRSYRDYEMCCKRYEEFQSRRAARREDGRENFEEDEADLNTRELLAEIFGGKGLLAGDRTIDRFSQFHDKDFPPDLIQSIGQCSVAEKVVGWKTSKAININTQLFHNGTDPDDIFQGFLNDGWLLSAISIVAASGGIGDGQVDELIDRLFVHSKHENCAKFGVYALRLWKNGQWETVVVDDFFPILSEEHKIMRSAGAAMAHTEHFQELWVPLMEKAYAKYYGSYAFLEKGAVHFALEDFTGGQSEEIFLASAGRGANRSILWNNLLGYYKNKFLLGAATITASCADRETLDSGLIFGATYVIYQVREEDGCKLIQLRNPPQYTEDEITEWKGDYSDTSTTWTKRLKKKCGWSASDDGTFWMSFDDFIIAFRSLFVCKYLDPTKWVINTASGWWKDADETSQGSPGIHNLECNTAKNPQFSLRIDRPTEIIITISQTENGMAVAGTMPHHICAFVTKGVKKDGYFRSEEITHDNVVASSGQPVNSRSIQITTNLLPRTYNLMVSTFKKQCEGPYTLTIHSNYPIGFDQIWPTADGEWKNPKTLVEQLKEVKVKANEKITQIKSGESPVKKTVTIVEEPIVVKKAPQLLDMSAPEKPKLDFIPNSPLASDSNVDSKFGAAPEIVEEQPWTQVWDESAQQYYYYNTVTEESSWDVPPDYKPPQ